MIDPGSAEFQLRARREALAALRGVLASELPPRRWPEAGKHLQEVEDGLSAGDWAALRLAAAALSEVSGTRITDVGTTPTVPAPEPLRQRIAFLVHSLTVQADEAHQAQHDERSSA